MKHLPEDFHVVWFGAGDSRETVELERAVIGHIRREEETVTNLQGVRCDVTGANDSPGFIPIGGTDGSEDRSSGEHEAHNQPSDGETAEQADS